MSARPVQPGRGSGIQHAFPWLYCKCQSLLLGLLRRLDLFFIHCLPRVLPTCLALMTNLVMGTQSFSQPASAKERSQLVKGAVGKVDLQVETRCSRKADFPPRIAKIHLLRRNAYRRWCDTLGSPTLEKARIPPKPFTELCDSGKLFL